MAGFQRSLKEPIAGRGPPPITALPQRLRKEAMSDLATAWEFLRPGCHPASWDGVGASDIGREIAYERLVTLSVKDTARRVSSRTCGEGWPEYEGDRLWGQVICLVHSRSCRLDSRTPTSIFYLCIRGSPKAHERTMLTTNELGLTDHLA
jgi:hypothetical protein